MKLALLAAVLALVAAAPAAASERHPTLAELEGEIICPTCHVTLDQSDSPIAQRIKQYISARIAAGDTKSEIKAKLVDQFGPTVLAVPPRKGFDWIAWLLPIGGLAVGAVVVGGLAWHWSRGRDDEPPPPGGLEPLDPELERRLDAELARFE